MFNFDELNEGSIFIMVYGSGDEFEMVSREK